MVVPSWAPTTSARARNSSAPATRDGTGRPSPSVCTLSQPDEKPRAPSVRASSSSRAMPATWSSVASPVDRRGAHHGAAQHRVADHERGVHGHPSVEPAEPLTEPVPVPGRPLLEGLDRDALDDGHQSAHVVGVAGRDRRDREAAVAADDGRDPVERRGGDGRVPEDLGVVVGVHVDEPRRDHHAGGVDRAASLVADRAHRDDAAVADRRRRPTVPALRCRRPLCRRG